MTAIAYPAGLPLPSQWDMVPFDRAVRSALPAAKDQRAGWRDALREVEWAAIYTPAEMATWRSWYGGTLLDGMRWFAMTAPGAGAWAGRVLKYRTATVREQPLGGGNFRVTARLQQRGRSAAPTLPCFVERFADGLVPYSSSNGGLARFEIVASPFGSALRYIGGTSATDMDISRTVAGAPPFGAASMKFLVESASADNSAYLRLHSGSTDVLIVVPRTDVMVDVQQRLQVQVGTDVALLTVLALNVWHELSVTAAGVYTLHRLDTGAQVTSGSFVTGETQIPWSSLSFVEDSNSGSAATRFADIEVCR